MGLRHGGTRKHPACEMAACEPPGALPPRHVRTPLPSLPFRWLLACARGESRARNLAPTEGAPLSRIRTSLHAHPKLLLTLTAAGSAVTAAVITLSGASAGQLASSPPAAAQGAAHPAAAAAPATFRPIATLDAAATS